ncbi:DNA-processing protein DprA, partial [Bordetella pertussis]|uniref:DNA-processing protein DprA n=1 Tax=Bordetella pertussis TaxID=520 RepID=UPI0021CB717D
HRDLAHRIVQHGALVSELPLGTGAQRHHFPRRNRLVAGLARGVLVVQAGRNRAGHRRRAGRRGPGRLGADRPA